MDEKKMDNAFIQHVSNVLGDTYAGLSGPDIIKYCAEYAVKFNVSIPITSSDFGRFGSIVQNKRTALYKNLLAFNGEQQFYIIKELCEIPHFEGKKSAYELKKMLFEKYYMFSNDFFAIKTALFSEKDSLRIQSYIEPSMHGNLESKKQILLKLAEQLEPKEPLLKGINKTFSSDLFMLINSCNIRHNNISIDSPKYKHHIAKMSKDELEHTYDEIYQMCLLAIMQLEHLERKKCVDELKDKIVNVK